MVIRSNFNHVPSEGLTCLTPSRTVQQFKDECDVNNILKNYVNTGILTHTTAATPMFGDFSQMPSDYGEAVALLEKSREQFMTLPSNVRERFYNDPKNLVSFLQDPKNRKEAEELGLVNKSIDINDKNTDSPGNS